MSETHGCCAHLKVTWRTKPVGNGAVTGWWQCEICPTHFFPVLATPASTARTELYIKFVTPAQAPDKWVVFLNGYEIQQFDFQFEAQAFGDNLKAAIFAAPGSVPPLKVEIVTPEELERERNDPRNYMCGVPQAEPPKEEK